MKYHVTTHENDGTVSTFNASSWTEAWQHFIDCAATALGDKVVIYAEDGDEEESWFYEMHVVVTAHVSIINEEIIVRYVWYPCPAVNEP